LISNSLTLFAQNKNHEVANSITRNLVIYQALNNFSTTVPVFFMIPGWYVFGSMEITHIPVFVDEAYYNNVDINSKTNAVHKELFDAIKSDFFPNIPIDKQMEVRVLDQGRLLYRMRFFNRGDSLELNQVSGNNQSEKLFFIYDGELRGINQSGKDWFSMQRTTSFGDTLRIQTKYNSKKRQEEKTEIRYHNGNPTSIHTFISKNSKSFKLKSVESYHYLEGRLASIEKSNSKGKLKYTTNFLHNYDGKLAMLRKYKADKIVLSIENRYKEDGMIEHKYVTTDKISYDIKYQNKNNTLSNFTINNLYPDSYNQFMFDLGISNKLSRIQYNAAFYSKPNQTDSESILFIYNQDENIESIRVIDQKGIITKQIQFEYAYFIL
jgi:hypothetical protein